MKKFIITIDTEGDNLWNWKPGDVITTENVKYLQRFQNLCSQYGFMPVWLSNWEMINDPLFVDFINKNVEKKQCELGMHLHAWNNPPYYDLPCNAKSGAPYLIEYPKDIMEAKIAAITNKMREQFGYVPVSHRAGRWAMNETYFELLYKYGYRIDCSYTPGIDWSGSVGQTPGIAGPDYKEIKQGIQQCRGVLEIPVTVKQTHNIFLDMHKELKSNIKTVLYGVKGQKIWLRPARDNIKEMLWLIRESQVDDSDYLMFMLHSSELMPGGSPTFRTEESIEKLFSNLHIVFEKIVKCNYEGYMLKEYIEEGLR